MIPEYIRGLATFFNKKNTSTDKSSSLAKLESSEKVDFILSDFNSALDFFADDFRRASDAWNLYSGIDNSQYPIKVKNKLEAEGKNIFQANFVRSKVEGLAGSIIKNFFDIGFEPINGNYSDLTKFVKQLLLIDKELLDWDQSYRQLVVDGLVQLGVEEMYISTRHDPLGNIGFRPVLPGHLILDPNWISNNSWDLKRSFKVAYLTPKEIKEIYKTKSQEVDDYIKLKENRAGDYDNGDADEGYPHYGMNSDFGDKYRVIEYHHMEKEKRKIQINIADGLQIPDLPDEYVKEWAILNNVNLDEGVISREEDVDVYYVTTICPSINRNLVLEDKRGLIQIGRLPFFPWSSGRINGKNSGIPDLLRSVQETYNFRESMLDYMISTSAVGGIVIDPDIVDSDEYKMKIIQDNWNKPGFRMFTAPGALSSGRQHFQELPRTQMDYGIVNEINRMLDMSDRISKQPSAMEGRSEGSEETGILYARKQLQAEITQTLLIKSLEQHWNEKGEAYLLCAKQLYSGVYRTIGVGDKEVTLNIPIVTPSGEVVENDISQLPRMKVCVTQSPEGTTIRAMDRAVNTELLRVLGQENPIARARAVKNVMKTLDVSKEDRMKYEEDSELEYMYAREQLVTNIMQMKATQVQLQAVLNPQPQQMMMGDQGAQGQGSPAMPQGGGGAQQTEPPQGPGNPAQSIGNEQAVQNQNTEIQSPQ